LSAVTPSADSPAALDGARVVVVVPTYNERDNLPVVTAALLRHDVEVLVVDDGSPDGTGAIADRLAHDSSRVSVLHRRGARGLGRSYVEGMQHALARGATHVCQMDADLSHDPDAVPQLVRATRDADVAIGSRYVPGGQVRNWPKRRRMLSAFANAYVRSLTGLSARDCTSGFRCWTRPALERLPLDRFRSDGYAFQVELTWEAQQAGCRLVEVPITFTERRVGRSKLSAGVILESVILPWRLAVGARLRRAPARRDQSHV
jgi:dolichol-phosphate mannosyltransferase